MNEFDILLEPEPVKSEFDILLEPVPVATGSEYDALLEPEPQTPGVIQAVPVVAKQEDSWGPAIAAQEARLADKPGLVDDFQNTWNSLKRGAFNARENFFGTGVVNALSASQEAQQAEKELADFDALVASNPQLQSSPNTLSQRNRLVSRMAELQGETAQRGETLGSNVQQVVRSREMAATVPVAGAMREFHEGNWVKALAENPVEVIAGISAESLPQMAPALLAGAISGPGGAALVGASSLGVEYSNTVIDSLKESKVDLANPDTFKNMTPEALESARKRAVQRGVPIAIFDAATAGLAGKVLKTQLGRGAGRAMLGVAAETGMQAAGGALGEATAQIASTGGVNDLKSVVSEAVGELVSTPSEVYGGLRESRKQEIQQPPSAPDLTDVAAILEEEDEAPTPTQGTAPAPEPPPTVTLAQQASANLLGTDATELRQQEAIVTGQPVPGLDELEATQQEQREWLNQNFPEEPAPEPVEEAAPVAVADEIVAEEGVGPTPVLEGLVALEPDTFERLADEPVQEGFVALQDPETNDVFQVPASATPEQVQEARTAAREQSQMAEIQFLREENARKFEEARREQDILESIIKEPILRKNLTSGERAREIWDVPSNLKFQLERQEMNLRKAKAGTLKDADGKPVPPAALEKGVQMLRDRYAELTAKVEPAKEAVKKMKRGKKAEEGSTQIPQAIVELGESLYRQGVEFKDWSRAMLRNLGDRVRPILKQIWDGIVNSVNALSPAQRRRIEGRMQRSAPAPEGGAVGSQGRRRGEGKYSVYPMNRGGKEVWMVQAGDVRGVGDWIFDTKEEADRNAQRERLRDEQRAESTRKLQAEQDAEVAAKAERENLDGFDEEMTPLQRGKVVQALTKQLNYRGQILTRRDLIRKMVAEGRRIEKEEGERILTNEAGEYLGQNVLTKTGLDYADHLIAMQREEGIPEVEDEIADRDSIAQPEPEAASPTPPETPAAAPEEPTGISLQNASSAESRARMGLDERVAPARRAFGQVWDEAMAQIKENPSLPTDLVTELSADFRILDDTDLAILLYEKIVRENALDLAIEQANTATGEANVQSAQEKMRRAQQLNEQIIWLTEKIGTYTARSLNFRKLFVSRDFTLEGMRQWTRAYKNKGEPLTPEQEKEVAEIYAENKRLKDLEAAREEERANENSAALFKGILDEFNKSQKKAKKEKKPALEFLREKADEARARRRARLGQLNAGIGLEDLADALIIGTYHVANGINTAAEFAAKLIEEFGADIEPHLPEIFKEAQSKNESVQKDLGSGSTEPSTAVERTPAEILATAKPELDPKVVTDLVRAYIREGMTDSAAVIERVHADLLPLIPGLEVREVRDAFTGYGKVTYPSKEEDAVRLRDFKNIERLTSQLEDVERRIAPMRTGPQRDAMSIKARGLQKQVNDLMRKYDLKAIDPQQQLKTAKEAVKTRLRNEIEELEEAINKKQRRTAGRTPTEDDPEIKALRARRDQIRSRYDEMFPREKMTPEQRVKQVLNALDKSIAEESQMLRDGILQRPPKAPGVSTPAIENKQMELDALRQLRRELFAATQPRKAPEDIALEQATKAAQASIDRMDQMLKTGNLDPTKRDPKFTPTAELEALWSERDAMRDALTELRKAQKPRKDPEEAARKRAVKTLQKSIEALDRRISTGDFSTAPRKATRPEVKEVAELREQRDLMRRALADMKKAATPSRSPYEIALSRNIKNTQKQIDALKEKIRTGDYSIKPPKDPIDDPVLNELKFERIKLKNTFLKGLFEAQLKNMGWQDRTYRFGLNAIGLLRAINSSIDFGALLRQGKPAVLRSLTSPSFAKTMVKEIFPVLKATVSEKGEFDLMEKLRARKNYAMYLASDLGILQEDELDIKKMNEYFASTWVKKTPGVAMSARAYNATLNVIRADLFDAIANSMSETGQVTLEDAKVISNAVNVASGQGNVGKGNVASAIPFLNSLLYATRFYVSRLQVLTFQPLWGGNRKGTGRARVAIAKEYARQLAGLAIWYGLAAMLFRGIEDEDDKLAIGFNPWQSGFGKIKVGQTTIDPMAGVSQFLVLLTRMISGHTANREGKVVPITGPDLKFKDTGFDTVVGSFYETKRSPLNAQIHDFLRRKHYKQPEGSWTPGSAALKALPMSFSETREIMEEHNVPAGVALWMLMMLGEGVMILDQDSKKGPKMTKTDFGPTMK